MRSYLKKKLNAKRLGHVSDGACLESSALTSSASVMKRIASEAVMAHKSKMFSI
jgi:hypothetical protein